MPRTRKRTGHFLYKKKNRCDILAIDMIKRAHLPLLALAVVGLGLPGYVLAAAFQGPASQPPLGNAPGVIWNSKANPAFQQDAEMNILGNGTIGGTASIGGDIRAVTGKTLSVDGEAATMFKMNNSAGTRPFSLYLTGDLMMSDLGAIQGQRGRVQASQFCFNPGAPADCITDWTSFGSPGNYVLKTGDTMTGNLIISPAFAPGNSLTITNGLTGVYSNASNYGVYGVGGLAGGYFTTTGNYAVYGNNTSAVGIGGKFSAAGASGIGVDANGGTTGVRGSSTASSGEGGEFTGLGVSGTGVLGTGNALNGVGVRGIANGSGAAFGGYFTGASRGMVATSTSGIGGWMAGATGLHAEGTIGGDFVGSSRGISASSPLVAGYFTAPNTGTGLQVSGAFIGLDISNVTGDAIRVTTPVNGRAVQLTMNGGDGVAVSGAKRMLVGDVKGLNSTGVQITSDDVGVSSIVTGVSGPNNMAGVFNSPSAYAQLGVHNRAGIVAASTAAGATAAGEFRHVSQNTITTYLNTAANAIEVQRSSTPIFAVNPTGEVHLKGTSNGYYFADRLNQPREWAWYSNGGNAYLYNNLNGNYLTINEATGAASNRKNVSTWDIVSDARLKTITGAYNKGLNEISKLNTVRFNYKDMPERGLSSEIMHQGVIAQEVEKIFPEAVTTGPDGYKTLNTDPIFWATVNSAKELKQENDTLKAKVESLEERMEKLEARMK